MFGFGIDLAGNVAELAALIGQAVDADDAIVDGVLTTEATRGGIGAATITEPKTNLMTMVCKHDPGVEVVRTSCRTGEGIAGVAAWLERRILAKRGGSARPAGG